MKKTYLNHIKAMLALSMAVILMLPLLTTSRVIAADGAQESFTDVPQNAWYCDNVKYVSQAGIMNGISKDTFAPNATLSRAMSVTVLYRMAGKPKVDTALPFTDVEKGKWYSDAVIWAYENGITEGKDTFTFAPHDEVTRAELAAFLCRYAYYAEIELPAVRDGNLSDHMLIPSYAKEAQELLYRAGVVNGLPGNRFVYYKPVTRAEAAAMISRLVTNSVKIDKDEYTYIVFIGNSVNGTGNIPIHFSALHNDSKVKVYSYDYSPTPLICLGHYEWFSANKHPSTRIAELCDTFIIQEGGGSLAIVGENKRLQELIGDRRHLPAGFPNGFCSGDNEAGKLMELLGDNKKYYTFTASDNIGAFNGKDNDTLLGIKKIYDEEYGLPLVYASDVADFNKELGLSYRDTFPDGLHPTRLMGYCAALTLYCSIYDLPASEQNNGDLKPEEIPGSTKAEKDAFMVKLKDTVQDILDIQKLR